MRAESLMALTNLTPDSDLDCLSPDPGILAVLTQMLLCAVRCQVMFAAALCCSIGLCAVRVFARQTPHSRDAVDGGEALGG